MREARRYTTRPLKCSRVPTMRVGVSLWWLRCCAGLAVGMHLLLRRPEPGLVGGRWSPRPSTLPRYHDKTLRLLGQLYEPCQVPHLSLVVGIWGSGLCTCCRPIFQPIPNRSSNWCRPGKEPKGASQPTSWQLSSSISKVQRLRSCPK